MITFISCLAILIIGYFVYGTYVDKNAKLSDDNQTPAVRLEDGVDYMPMPWYKVFLSDRERHKTVSMGTGRTR